MTLLETRISGLVLLEAKVYPDERGHFFEAFQAARYAEVGISGPFVQDNVSISKTRVLRGLHFQSPNPQGKLVQVLMGEVWDVAVDLRTDSATFGDWEGHFLSSENHRQFYIPDGFAHGFVVTQGPALLSYKCTAYYDPKGDTTLRFDDPEVAIEWPVKDGLVLSDKDRKGLTLAEIRLL